MDLGIHGKIVGGSRDHPFNQCLITKNAAAQKIQEKVRLTSISPRECPVLGIWSFHVADIRQEPVYGYSASTGSVTSAYLIKADKVVKHQQRSSAQRTSHRDSRTGGSPIVAYPNRAGVQLRCRDYSIVLRD